MHNTKTQDIEAAKLNLVIIFWYLELCFSYQDKMSAVKKAF